MRQEAPDAQRVMAALFAKIGPAILFTHSQGGGPGWLTAIKNANVKAIVACGSYRSGSWARLQPLGVEANHGRIYARSLAGCGCVFTVDLPRVPVPTLTTV